MKKKKKKLNVVILLIQVTLIVHRLRVHHFEWAIQPDWVCMLCVVCVISVVQKRSVHEWETVSTSKSLHIQATCDVRDACSSCFFLSFFLPDCVWRSTTTASVGWIVG